MFAVFMVISLSGCEKTCETCSGSGSVDCDSCENGKVVCVECNGEKQFRCKKCTGGKVSSDEECSKCDDSKRPGKVFDTAQAFKDIYYGVERSENAYWDTCNRCNGTAREPINCPDCDGSGLGDVCIACDGSGENVCSSCKGTLTVTCDICTGKGKV